MTDATSPAMRGVNLGNWLLIEHWMSPSLHDSPKELDEYRISAALGDQAEAVIRRHRERWITEADFAWLAERGINAVRIPFGYWILEPDGPYVGSPELLDQAIDLCDKHGMQALLDLHGLPGAQGPEHHTGRADHFQWPSDPGKFAQSLDVIEAIAQRYAGRSCIAGFSVVNEPHESIERDALVDFYDKACERVRRHMPADDVAVVIAAYPEGQMDTYHGSLPGRANVWTDVHLYQSFQPWPDADPFSYLMAAVDRHERLSRWIARGPVIVGEWSLSWPRELGRPMRRLSPLAYDQFMRAYGSIQLASFDQTTGWFFWSYRVDDQPHWSFRDAVERGWLPDHFDYDPIESVDAALNQAIARVE